MKTDADHTLDRLLEAARGTELDALEYGFETRLAARLREEDRGRFDIFNWAWRLCPFFAVLAIAAGLWSRTTTARVQSDAQIIAEATRGGDVQLLLSYMTEQTPR